MDKGTLNVFDIDTMQQLMLLFNHLYLFKYKDSKFPNSTSLQTFETQTRVQTLLFKRQQNIL
jgi:hypothetical protein